MISALPVAPSLLHDRQTKILLAIQEMKRTGRRAVSLRIKKTCLITPPDTIEVTRSLVNINN